MSEWTSSVGLRQVGLNLLAASSLLAGLSCSGGDITQPTTATLKIMTVTTGPNPDADGYAFTVDGGAAQPIGVNASASVSDLTVGIHSVVLSGLATNCAMQGESSRSVPVSAGATAEVSFAVSCAATTGSIQVSISTTGSSLDADAYLLSLDGGASQPIGINTSLTLSDRAPGSHTLALSGVANNCHTEGENPRTVEVLPNVTVTVTFTTTCTTPLIVFTSGGVVSVVKPDGTGLTKLTAGSAPNWSPDRRKILFEDGGLYVMNADGTSQAILVKDQNDFQVVAYHWSPDGRRIAFLAERCFSYPSCKGFVRDLWVMEADGSRQLMLRAIVSDASWSPDGRKLAFAGGDQLFTINSDGSGGEVRVSDQVFQIGDEAPAWSPDGALIASGALTASGGYGIYVIHPDGSGLVNLTPDPGAYGENPAWSADGSKIAFYYSPDNPSSQGSVAVVNRDGSGRVILTNTGYRNFHWSPDGTQIAFVRNAELQRSDVWVMNADGTGQINVSNTPDADEDFPDW